MKAPTADPPIELYDVSEEQNSGGKLMTARKNLKIVIINQFMLFFLLYFFEVFVYFYYITIKSFSCFINNEVLFFTNEPTAEPP